MFKMSRKCSRDQPGNLPPDWFSNAMCASLQVFLWTVFPPLWTRWWLAAVSEVWQQQRFCPKPGRGLLFWSSMIRLEAAHTPFRTRDLSLMWVRGWSTQTNTHQHSFPYRWDVTVYSIGVSEFLPTGESSLHCVQIEIPNWNKGYCWIKCWLINLWDDEQSSHSNKSEFSQSTIILNPKTELERKEYMIVVTYIIIHHNVMTALEDSVAVVNTKFMPQNMCYHNHHILQLHALSPICTVKANQTKPLCLYLNQISLSTALN